MTRVEYPIISSHLISSHSHFHFAIFSFLFYFLLFSSLLCSNVLQAMKVLVEQAVLFNLVGKENVLFIYIGLSDEWGMFFSYVLYFQMTEEYSFHLYWIVSWEQLWHFSLSFSFIVKHSGLDELLWSYLNLFNLI